MDKLPVKMHGEIGSHLEAADLLTYRRVCRHSKVGVEDNFLRTFFNQRAIYTNRGLVSLAAISFQPHLARTIQQLYVVLRPLRDVTPEYASEGKDANADCENYDKSYAPGVACKPSSSGCKCQSTWHRGIHNAQLLSHVFSQLSEYGRLTSLTVADSSPSSSSAYGSATHMTTSLPGTLYLNHKDYNNASRSVLRAALDAELGVVNLDLGYENQYIGLTGDALSLGSNRRSDMLAMWTSLSVLKLALEPGARDLWLSTTHCGLSRLLSVAVNITELGVNFMGSYYDSSDIENFSAALHAPRLRKLELKLSGCEYLQIEDLIKKCSTSLQELSVTHTFEYSWVLWCKVFVAVTQLPHIMSVHFCNQDDDRQPRNVDFAGSTKIQEGMRGLLANGEDNEFFRKVSV